MSLDANKKESERCIQLGLMCLRGGYEEKALQFFQKADRLFSTNKTQDLIGKLEKKFKEDGKIQQNGSAPMAEDYGAFDHYEDGSGLRNRFDKKSPTSKENADTGDTNNNKDKNEKIPSNPSASSSLWRRNGQNVQRQRNAADKMTRSGSGQTDLVREEGSAKKPTKPQLGIDYTKEQLESVNRLRHCNDYYQILNVPKEFTEEELKRQYKKLALKLHPDKNTAPGAADAFKAFSRAYEVLSNPTKRERYDMYGGVEELSADGATYPHAHHNNDDMTPEEIFNMFFGNVHVQHERPLFVFPSGRLRHITTQLCCLFIVVPLIVVILFGVIFRIEPAFSLQQTNKYSERRVTRDLRVPYYVKLGFLEMYGRRLKQMEKQVHEEYVNKLRVDCFTERSNKNSMLWRARVYGDDSMFKNAHGLHTPSCEKLSKIYT